MNGVAVCKCWDAESVPCSPVQPFGPCTQTTQADRLISRHHFLLFPTHPALSSLTKKIGWALKAEWRAKGGEGGTNKTIIKSQRGEDHLHIALIKKRNTSGQGNGILSAVMPLCRVYFPGQFVHGCTSNVHVSSVSSKRAAHPLFYCRRASERELDKESERERRGYVVTKKLSGIRVLNACSFRKLHCFPFYSQQCYRATQLSNPFSSRIYIIIYKIPPPLAYCFSMVESVRALTPVLCHCEWLTVKKMC